MLRRMNTARNFVINIASACLPVLFTGEITNLAGSGLYAGESLSERGQNCRLRYRLAKGLAIIFLDCGLQCRVKASLVTFHR